MRTQGNYHKINKQMKFQFLKRVLGQGQPLYDVAKEIGINYATAKTIVFFQRHAHKSYRSFKFQATTPQLTTRRAEYQAILASNESNKKIEIVTNKCFFRWQARKEVKAGNIQLTYLRNNKPLTIKNHPISKDPSFSINDPKVQENNRTGKKRKQPTKKQSAESSDSQYVCTQ